MLARTLFNQIFLFKPSQIPLSALSISSRSITTTARFKYLTGSTADTFLEYVQRNLPGGIMMIVERVHLEPFRDNLVPPSSSAISENNAEKQRTF